MVEREEGLTHKNRPDIAEVKRPISYRWNQKWIPLIEFVKNWQEEHPGRRGAQNIAGKRFGISRERARQILSSYPDESLKPKATISLTQLAHQIGVKPKEIFNLLHRGKISFGNEKIDRLYLQAEQLNPSIRYTKRILISSVDIDKLKRKVTEPKSIKELMGQDLTISIAHYHKETFISLSKLARQVGIIGPTEIPKVYNELISAGFSLKKFPHLKTNQSYYFAHCQEASSIIEYLQKRYHVEPKVKLFLGPTESYIPTTWELLRQKDRFISPSKTLKESGLKFQPKAIPTILEKILGKESTIPVYLYLSRYKSKVYKNIRIPKDRLEDFRNLVLAKKEKLGFS